MDEQRRSVPVQVPCTASVGWDLDHGEAADWLAALDACRRCPLQVACAVRRDALYPAPRRPAGVIWAGVAYGDDSRPLSSAQLCRRGSRGAVLLSDAS